MAYMNTEQKQKLAPRIKEILKQYGLKGSLSVSHHMTLILTIQSGKIDFFNDAIDPRIVYDAGYINVNEYYIKEHFKSDAGKCLSELRDAMMIGNHDRSDIMTDYFDVGWYIDIRIGKWDKPYKLTK